MVWGYRGTDKSLTYTVAIESDVYWEMVQNMYSVHIHQKQWLNFKWRNNWLGYYLDLSAFFKAGFSSI